MIEKMVLDHLTEKLDVPVGMEVPEQKQQRYVVIEKTGGAQDGQIYKATIAIQSVAESLYQAALLNEQVKEQMENITDNWEVPYCNLNADYNFTDTRTKTYRYQAVYDIVHY